MGIREAVGAALLSTHLETQAHESAIDRIGALARAGKLGRALYHWAMRAGALRGSGPPGDATQSRRRLRIGKFHEEHPTWSCCQQAMREWYAPQCGCVRARARVVSNKLRLIFRVRR